MRRRGPISRSNDSRTASCADSSTRSSRTLGANGRKFYHHNYRWEVVEGKYNRMLETLSRADRSLPPEKPGFFKRLFSSGS